LILIKLLQCSPLALSIAKCCAFQMASPARTLIELNIKHYRELLKTETDASKRRTVARLLAEQEATLAKLLAEKNGDD
jgi:hypothetical protein